MNWSGKVLLWEEYGLFLGSAGTAEPHESPAIKICIALEGDFGLRITETESWTDYTSAIIPAGLAHAIEGRGNKMAMFLLAPEGDLGQLLIPLTSENNINEIPARILKNILEWISIFGASNNRLSHSTNACRRRSMAAAGRTRFKRAARVFALN